MEWLRFLKQIGRETPRDLTIHVIADNYATHKHAKVKDWLKKHTRFHVHFTPTGSSWMNLIERFFADLTTDCIREGSFQSVRELVDAIEEYLKRTQREPEALCLGVRREKKYFGRSHARRRLSEGYHKLIAHSTPAPDGQSRSTIGRRMPSCPTSKRSSANATCCVRLEQGQGCPIDILPSRQSRYMLDS